MQTVIGLILRPVRSLKNDFVRLYSNRVQFVLLLVLPPNFSIFFKIMLRFQRVSLKNLLFSLVCSLDLFRLYILFSQHRSCANTQEALSFLFFFFIKKSACNIFMLACALFNEQNKGPILLSISTWFVLGKQNVQAKKIYSPCTIWLETTQSREQGVWCSKLSVTIYSPTRFGMVGKWCS